MQNNPPIVVDLLRGNPQFEENIKPLAQFQREPLMAQPERTLHEYALPTLDVVRGSIERTTIIWPKKRTTINANNFEINMVTLQMIQNNLKFRGNMMEDPNHHLKRFLQLCDTFKYNGVTGDAICL